MSVNKSQSPIKVKFLTRDNPQHWRRQLPSHAPILGNCEFTIDKHATDYDWLVVYDDLPSKHSEPITRRHEKLACPRENTILVTTEPSNIKTYGRLYVEQFGHVLTSQEPWALHHPNRVYAQACLRWFYGAGADKSIDLDQLALTTPPVKSKNIATVCSTKQQKHTLHNQRYKFVQNLRLLLPELDVYGHGVHPISDKAEAITAYRYHIAIENHSALHHWTEKLADPFLGYSLPFYYGCTNVADYFPENSFIPIDIYDVVAASGIIKQAIENNEYQKRLPAIVQARELVLKKYNLFTQLAAIITQHHQPDLKTETGFVLVSRRAARNKNLFRGLLDLFDKFRIQFRNRFKKHH